MRWRGSLTVCVVGAIAAACLPLGVAREDVAGDAWIEISTPHIHLETDVRASRAVPVAWLLEDTAIALYDVFPPCTLASLPPPIEVTLLANMEDMREVTPTVFAGRYGRGLSGLVTSPARLVAGHEDAALVYQTLAHELTHQFVDYCYPNAPVWLHEGLASFHETIEVERERTIVGRSPFRVRTRRSYGAGFVDGAFVMHIDASRLPPVSRLVMMGSDEFHLVGIPNSGLARGGHYASAWSLVHYGLLGPDPGFRAAFSGFLAEIAAGETDPAMAFARHLAASHEARAALDDEITRYFARDVYLERRVERTAPTIDDPVPSEMRPSDVHVHWAELFLSRSPPAIDSAREHLTLAGTVRALVLRAYLAEGAERAALLAQARARSPDDLDLLLFEAGLAMDDVRSEHAVQLLARVEMRGDLRASELVALARLLHAGGRAPRAVPHARRAVILAPASPEAQLVLGLSLRASGDDVGAEAPLRRAVAMLGHEDNEALDEVVAWLAHRPPRALPSPAAGIPLPPPSYGP